MRTFCQLLLVLLLVSCSTLARAVVIRTQDPNYTSITTTPSTFSFTVCPTRDPYLDRGSPISADGCFGGVNEVNSTITSLTLTFADTAAIQNSGPDGASSDIFQSATFSEANGFYTFLFTGGNLVEAQTFVITEDGVTDPNDFPIVTLTYATPTPEPTPLLLLLTGLVCIGGSQYVRRSVA